jgi:hypothetical protein
MNPLLKKTGLQLEELSAKSLAHNLMATEKGV